MNGPSHFYYLTLFAVAISGCQRPAPVSSPSASSITAPRLVRPEAVLIPPELAAWPQPVANGQFPHYPPGLRNMGVEARVVTAFVIDESGRPEYRTISILESPATHGEFVTSVCTFLRSGAEFSSAPHAPARALVIMPFVFTLEGVAVTERPSPEPNLSAVRDSTRHMSPTELSAWVEAKPHCV